MLTHPHAQFKLSYIVLYFLKIETDLYQGNWPLFLNLKKKQNQILKTSKRMSWTFIRIFREAA